MYMLATQYFYSAKTKRPTLPDAAVKALISKVLQAKPWKEAAEAGGVRWGALMLLLREVVKTLLSTTTAENSKYLSSSWGQSAAMSGNTTPRQTSG